MISRRALLAGAALASASWRAHAEDDEAIFRRQIAALESRNGGRLGVAWLDTASGRRLAHRGDERFAMCSTFKFLVAAFVLARVDRGQERLDRTITYDKADLVTYSPVTEKFAGRGPEPGSGQGMSVAALCEAAVTLSDNTAANLLLDSLGGPAGLTGFAHSLGDDITRLDRRETELNEALPGDVRDTTTPQAMLGLMQRTIIGNVLSEASRRQLIDWLVANKTGDKRIRAGLPSTWRVGDKTGTGGNNATNDIAVIWPPNRPPILLAAYYLGGAGSEAQRSAVLADIGRLAAASLR